MGPKSEQIQDSKQTKNTAGNFATLSRTCSYSGRASLDTLWIGNHGMILNRNWLTVLFGFTFPSGYCCYFHLVVLVCTCVGR